MKTLILGCNGQLGQALAETAPGSVEAIGFDLPELDVTRADAVMALCRSATPDVIINSSAYTAVDQAELEVNIATAVNVDGPRNIAAAASSVGARLIHISTDFVFDGEASRPYQPDAATNPLSVYGETKRAGEVAALELLADSTVVVRTAWLYSKTGSNFVKTMLRLMDERDEISVVSDQRGAPTWANSLAIAIWKFAMNAELSGVHHWTDRGECSWFEFASAIQEEAFALGLLDKHISIQPISSADYPTAAVRPPYSVLDCTSTYRAIGFMPEKWRDNLREMLKGLVK